MRQLIITALVLGVSTSCSTSGEELRSSEPALITQQGPASDAEEDKVPEVDGTVESYVGTALHAHPGLAKHAELWRAATHRADAASAWPRTTITYAFLPLPIETRLGPQRHRIAVRQGIPWPGQRDAASRAELSEASVEEARLDATANAVREEVEHAYWDLWQARKTGQILSEQVTVLETSARIARGAVEVGQAGLSSVARIELAAARLRERQAANTAKIAAAEQRLRGAIRAQPAQLPTTPAAFSPDLPENIEVNAAPELEALRRNVEAAARKAEAADASAKPTFSVGVDYIFVDEGEAMADEAGRDALMLMVGLTFPSTWAAEGARAEASRSMQKASEHAVIDAEADRAAKAATLLELARDAQRRHNFFRDTLLPQAENAFEASLGDYESGRAGVADLLLTQREWLELQIGLAAARADFERARATLARLQGAPAANGQTNE